MPTWLAEGSTSVYVVLAALALVVLFVAWQYRDRSVPIGGAPDRRRAPRCLGVLPLGLLVAAVLVLLAGVVRLVDHLIVTDREQIVQAVEEMAAGVRARDKERVFRQVSETFRSPGGNTREGFKPYAERYIERGDDAGVQVWDYRFEEAVSRSTRQATVLFKFKVKANLGGGELAPFYVCKATFHLDPDDRWRLQTFRILNPVNNEEIAVPF